MAGGAAASGGCDFANARLHGTVKQRGEGVGVDNGVEHGWGQNQQHTERTHTQSTSYIDFSF